MPTKAFEDGVKAGLKGEDKNPYGTTVSDVVFSIVTGGLGDIINKETGAMERRDTAEKDWNEGHKAGEKMRERIERD